MIRHIKVTTKNLRFLYSSESGNLYFRQYGKNKPYEVVDDWTFEDLYDGICYEQIELIWIEGPSLGTNVEV